jgi:predicted TIM-barrel fold metal-dependent hydrolase
MNSNLATLRVDSHFHVFQAHVGIATSRYVPTYDASINTWQTLAHAQGVQGGVLIQPSFLGDDNSQMLQAMATAPDLLKGVVVVSPQVPAAMLKAWHAQGVRGIRLNFAGVSHDMTVWRQATTLWDALLALGWHVELHTDQGRLPEVLPWLPSELSVVIDHMAKPQRASALDETVRLLAKQANRSIYIKLSGAYRLGGVDAQALAKLWLSERGETNLLWGSDWPCTNHESLSNYPQLLNALAEWVGPSHVETILSTNPRRLYWS